MEETMIRLMNVTKKYRGTAALNNCNLKLEKGKIYGLVGKNGAGKTTMMRIIAGLSIPSSGQLQRMTANMGTLIEAPGVIGSMTAKENLKFYRMLCVQEKTNDNGMNHVQDKTSDNPIDSTKENNDKFKLTSDEELLQLVGLDNITKKKVKDFSLGMRQRLGIAIALLGNPDFLMLDEPVNGLDPLGVVEIRKLVQKLNEEQGMTILISSHNLAELYQTATDYIIIDNGVIKKKITQEQLDKENYGSLEEYFLSAIQQNA